MASTAAAIVLSSSARCKTRGSAGLGQCGSVDEETDAAGGLTLAASELGNSGRWRARLRRLRLLTRRDPKQGRTSLGLGMEMVLMPSTRARAAIVCSWKKRKEPGQQLAIYRWRVGDTYGMINLVSWVSSVCMWITMIFLCQ
jgi:hypothetical protein